MLVGKRMVKIYALVQNDNEMGYATYGRASTYRWLSLILFHTEAAAKKTACSPSSRGRPIT